MTNRICEICGSVLEDDWNFCPYHCDLGEIVRTLLESLKTVCAKCNSREKCKFDITKLIE